MAHHASLATKSATAVHGCGTLEAHDLRNLLAALALHLETQQRLSGPNGAKAADAAHAIIERAAALCDVALDSGAQTDASAAPTRGSCADCRRRR